MIKELVEISSDLKEQIAKFPTSDKTTSKINEIKRRLQSAYFGIVQARKDFQHMLDDTLIDEGCKENNKAKKESVPIKDYIDTDFETKESRHVKK